MQAAPVLADSVQYCWRQGRGQLLTGVIRNKDRRPFVGISCVDDGRDLLVLEVSLAALLELVDDQESSIGVLLYHLHLGELRVLSEGVPNLKE